MRRRTGRLVVLLAAVVLAGSCGSDEEVATTTTPSPDAGDWATALEAECAALNRDYAELEAADPANRDEATAYAQQVAAFADELARAVDADGAPEAAAEDAADLEGLVEELADAADALAAAADAGDAAAAESATDELDRVGAAINPVAERLDVPACGGF